MLYALMRNWWAVALRGVAALLFGVTVAVWPGTTALGLVALFAAHAAVDGALALWVALANPSRHAARRLVLLEGLVSLGFAAGAIVWPGLTAFLLALAVGARAAIVGGLQLLGAAALRCDLERERLLGLCGVAGLLLGVAIAARVTGPPLAGTWLIAVHALVTGILLVALALRLRQVRAAMTRVLSRAA
jgi:uncharacterized membrane protein HdeD (DUF308 family)